MPDRIEILIRRKQAEARKRRPRPAPPKDIGSRRRQNDPLPRRLRRSGLINFWDLGSRRKSGGGWEDLDYYVLRFEGSLGPLGDIHAVPPTLEDWQQQQDEIFAIPVSEWKTEYRKLAYEDAERFAIDLFDPQLANGPENIPVRVFSAARAGSRLVNNIFEVEPGYFDTAPVTGDQWSPAGLAASEFSAGPGTLAFQSAGAFVDFGWGRPYQKVTASRDFHAPAVDFALAVGQPVNVFLFPRLCAHVLGYNLDGADASTVIGPFKQLSRSLFLDMPFAEIAPSWFGINIPVLSNFNSAGGVVGGAHAAAIVSHVKSYPVSRGFTISFGEITEGETGDAYAFATEQQGVMFTDIDRQAVPPTGNYPVGMLCGAIEQGGQMYYFWMAGDPGAPLATHLAVGKFIGFPVG